MTAGELLGENERSRWEAVQFGVASDFAQKAYATPNSVVWFPTTQELLTAGYVTEVSNGQFALSGFGSRPNRDEALKKIRETPIFDAVALADPARFERMANVFMGGVIKGNAEGQVYSKMRAMLPDVLKAMIPNPNFRVWRRASH